MCAWSPLCRDGIPVVVIKFTKSRKLPRRFFIFYGVRVGTLFYPHLPNRTGFGDLKIQSDDFLEYFAGGDCDGAPPLCCVMVGE